MIVPQRSIRFTSTVCLAFLSLLSLGLASGCRQACPVDDFPSRPIKLVVPFGAGGGTDTYARIIKQAIEEEQLLDQPLVVVNISGAGATTGSRRVKEAEPDGYSMLILHDTIITAEISGAADYGPDAFTPIAGTCEVGMVIAVSASSPYHSLDDLLTAAERDPDTIGFGHNQGALTHFAALQVQQQRSGAKFRLAHIGGGAERFSNLKAGHIAATGFSIEEFARFRSDGLRGLAYFGPERHQAAPDVPTAVEQGMDIVSVNTFYWWYPKNTPRQRVEFMAGVLQRAMQTELVQQRMQEIYCEPIFIRGGELQRRIADSRRRLSQVQVEEANPLPLLPEVLAALAVGCLGVTLALGRGERATPTGAAFRSRYDLAAAVFVCTVLYVIALGWPYQFALPRIDYRLTTAAFVACCGVLLCGRDPRRLVAVAAVAIVAPVVVHAVFTRLLEFTLPGS